MDIEEMKSSFRDHLRRVIDDKDIEYHLGKIVEICQLFETEDYFRGRKDGLMMKDFQTEPKPDEGRLLTDKKIESITAKALRENPHWEVDAWGLFSVVTKEQRDLTLSRFRQAVKDSIAGKPLDLTEEEFGIFCSIEDMYIDRISKVKEKERQERVYQMLEVIAGHLGFNLVEPEDLPEWWRELKKGVK